MQDGRCGLCWYGVLVWRTLLWILWICTALPFRVAETLIVGVAAEYLQVQLRTDWRGFCANFVIGLFLSYGVLLPIARLETHHPGALCTCYLSTIAWMVGNVCMNIIIYTGFTYRLKIDKQCPCLVQGTWRLRIPTDAGYVGLALGLSFAFPVASLQFADPSRPVPELMEWCRPTHAIAAEYIYGPVFLGALLAANIDTSPVRTRARERSGRVPDFHVYSAGTTNGHDQVFAVGSEDGSDDEDTQLGADGWGDADNTLTSDDIAKTSV